MQPWVIAWLKRYGERYPVERRIESRVETCERMTGIGKRKKKSERMRKIDRTTWLRSESGERNRGRKRGKNNFAVEETRTTGLGNLVTGTMPSRESTTPQGAPRTLFLLLLRPRNSILPLLTLHRPLSALLQTRLSFQIIFTARTLRFHRCLYFPGVFALSRWQSSELRTLSQQRKRET